MMPSAICLQLLSGAARAARPSPLTSWLPDWSIRTGKVVRPECWRTSANEGHFLQQSPSLQPVATMGQFPGQRRTPLHMRADPSDTLRVSIQADTKPKWNSF